MGAELEESADNLLSSRTESGAPDLWSEQLSAEESDRNEAARSGESEKTMPAQSIAAPLAEAHSNVLKLEDDTEAPNNDLAKDTENKVVEAQNPQSSQQSVLVQDEEENTSENTDALSGDEAEDLDELLLPESQGPVQNALETSVDSTEANEKVEDEDEEE